MRQHLDRHTLTVAGCILAGILLTGCATTIVRNAVPPGLANQVEVVGVQHVRLWGDAPIENLNALAEERHQQISTTRPHILKKKTLPVNLLALSGGGSSGAFGAGFLNGWTASGKRPDFEVVSGVSAGALLAPFAFLGPAYDRQAREIFTLYGTKEILRRQVLAGLSGGTAVTSSEPLANLIARYVDRSFLTAVAAEHAKGRRLLVGTTNLDAERPVVWNMGRIAQQNSNQALALFRKVLLASASIPGIFPPVFIGVTTDGKVYQEMHVDGGTTDNAFLLPAQFDVRSLQRAKRAKEKLAIYVIVNAKTDPDPISVKPNTFDILGRSISTMIRQQTEGDLLRLYLRAKKNAITFRMASVPVEFDVESKEPFDKRFMSALYATGYESALKGYKWKRKPPGV